MARCKCCHRKGFMIETDVNGLCAGCAPYYYLTMPSDLKALEQTLHALNRIDNAAAAIGRLETARECLERLRPYVEAGLARLSKPLAEIEKFLDQLTSQLE